MQSFPLYEPCLGDACQLDSDTAVCEEHFVNVRNTHHRAKYHKDEFTVVHLLPEGKQ